MAEQKNSVGVIVGRFQVPSIGRGHNYVVTEVMKRHPEVCVVLGFSEAQLTKNNPMPPEVRSLMLQNRYKPLILDRVLADQFGYQCRDLTVCSLKDAPSDEAWSRNLDSLIEDVFPGMDVTLYGSRDSFASHYHGKFSVEKLKHIHLESGTQSRTGAAGMMLDSDEFRAGIIWAAYHRYAHVYPTVDVVVLKPKERLALLGFKDTDGGKYRFPGGFVDPTDDSAKTAAAREIGEEVLNIRVGDFSYLDSIRIDDHRYRGTEDKIMTTFFSTEHLSGEPEAGDDLDEVRWFPYEDVGQNLIDSHIPLGSIFNALVRDAVVS